MFSERVLNWSVPQGSRLGAPLYYNYTRPIRELIKLFMLLYHLFADDSQIYKAFNPSKSQNELHTYNSMQSCLMEIRHWMSNNKLKLNNDKTEFLILTSKYEPPELQKDSMDLCGCQIKCSKSEKNLGVVIDEHITLADQVSCTNQVNRWGCCKCNVRRDFFITIEHHQMFHNLI